MLTGEQLRMARAALRLTVKALADLAGVDKGTIVRIEAGEKSYRRTLKDLREALEKRGVVFLDAEDGVRRPGVALGWDVALDSEGEGRTDATSKPDDGLASRAWDEDFEEFGQSTGPNIPPMTDEERALMRQYYATHPDRWARLSPLGKAVLARTMLL